MDTDLIYGIDDRPPLKETLFAAILSGRDDREPYF